MGALIRKFIGGAGGYPAAPGPTIARATGPPAAPQRAGLVSEGTCMVFAIRLLREKGFSPPDQFKAPKVPKKYGPEAVPLERIDSFEVPGCSILYSQQPVTFRRPSRFKKGEHSTHAFETSHCRTSFVPMPKHAGLKKSCAIFRAWLIKRQDVQKTAPAEPLPDGKARVEFHGRSRRATARRTPPWLRRRSMCCVASTR